HGLLGFPRLHPGPMGGGCGPGGPAIHLRVQSDLPTGRPRSVSGRHLPRPVRPVRGPVLRRRTRRGRGRSGEVLRTRTTLCTAEDETVRPIVPARRVPVPDQSGFGSRRVVHQATAGYGHPDPCAERPRTGSDRPTSRAIPGLGGEASAGEPSEAPRTDPSGSEEAAPARRPRCPPDVRDARGLAPLDGGRDQGGDGHLDEERIVTGRDESLLPGPLSGPARIGEGASGRTVSRGPRKGLGGPTAHGGGAVRKLKIRPLR